VESFVNASAAGHQQTNYIGDSLAHPGELAGLSPAMNETYDGEGYEELDIHGGADMGCVVSGHEWILKWDFTNQNA
jgi:hypothetical protein